MSSFTLKNIAVPVMLVGLKMAWFEEEWSFDGAFKQILTAVYFAGAMKTMKNLEIMQGTLEEVQTKCNYMERRLMRAAGGYGDFSRQVAGVVKSYDPALGHKGVEHVWLERQCRELFESRMQKVQGNCTFVWRLLCTEVAWRHARDCLAERMAAAFTGVLEYVKVQEIRIQRPGGAK